MKIFAFFAFVLFSTHTHAKCADDFNSGLSEYHFASKYFQTGVAKYNKAVSLSGGNNPDFMKICNLLVDSVSGFSVALDSFNNCGDLFNRAATSCSGNDAVQAGDNRDVCIGNADISSDNHKTLRSLLSNTCFKQKIPLHFQELDSIKTLSVR